MILPTKTSEDPKNLAKLFNRRALMKVHFSVYSVTSAFSVGLVTNKSYGKISNIIQEIPS